MGPGGTRCPALTNRKATVKPSPHRCKLCPYFIAGFRGRYVHVDAQGALVRADHEPESAVTVSPTVSVVKRCDYCGDASEWHRGEDGACTADWGRCDCTEFVPWAGAGSILAGTA